MRLYAKKKCHTLWKSEYLRTYVVYVYRIILLFKLACTTYLLACLLLACPWNRFSKKLFICLLDVPPEYQIYIDVRLFSFCWSIAAEDIAGTTGPLFDLRGWSFSYISSRCPMLMLSPARSEMRTRKRDLIFPLSGASKKARFYKKHAALTNLNLTRGAVSRSVMPTFSRPCSFIQLLTIFRFRSSPSYSISAIKATRSRRYFVWSVFSCAPGYPCSQPWANCVFRVQVEATEVFFAVTKLFQSSDSNLRRMVYLIIKEICPSADEVGIFCLSFCVDKSGHRCWICVYRLSLLPHHWWRIWTVK